MKKIILNIIAVTALIVVASESMFAQTCTITGNVKEGPLGSLLSGVTITIQGTGIGGMTNVSGHYNISNVPIGTGIVTVVASVPGTWTSTKTIVVQQNMTFTVNFWSEAVTDTEGNSYSGIEIGTQVWMGENLKYLPEVSPSNSTSNTVPRYYVNQYQGTVVSEAKLNSNYSSFGALYNWRAAMASCPVGWHLPTDNDWKQLEVFLGMSQSEADVEGATRGTTEGGKLKAVGTTYWDAPNTGATNVSGFFARAGGYLSVSPSGFYNLRTGTGFWVATDNNQDALRRYLVTSQSTISNYYYGKDYGFSVRCIKGIVNPVVSTSVVSAVTQTTATCGGSVISNGGSPITTRGVCWSTSPSPVMTGYHTYDGYEMGNYISSLTGLAPNTTYYVRAYVTNSIGTTSYGENVSFTTLSCPTIVITSAATASVCDNTALNYTATSSPVGATFAWTRAAVTGIANPAGAGTTATINESLNNTTTAPVSVTYVITPSIGGCAGTPFNLVVTVHPLPAITNKTTTICSGATFAVTPMNPDIIPPGTTYSWAVPVVTGGISGGAAGAGAANISGTLNNPTNIVQTATYIVTPLSGSCIGETFTVTVTVNPNPTVNVGGAIAAICQGGTTAALGGSFGGGATSAVWSDGQAGGNFTNNEGSTPGTTTYTAAAGAPASVTLTLTTSGELCGTVFATKILIVNPLPTINLGGAVAAICQGGTTAALGGSVGGGAPGGIWSTSAGGTFNPSATELNATWTPPAGYSGTATLFLSTTGGSCGVASGSKTVTVNPNPSVNVGGAVAAICQGGTTAALGGSFGGGATSAVWSDGEAGGNFTNNEGLTPGTTTYTAAAGAPASVTLTLTTSGGLCGTVFATKNLTVNPLPTINLGGAVAAICQGGTTAALGGSVGGGAPGGIWLTSAGGTFNPSATELNATWTPPAGYSGTATLFLFTTGGSCGVASGSKTVTVNPNPVTTINGQTNVLCFGNQTGAIDLEMTVGTAPYTYLWSNGKTTQDITNLAAQTYSVTVTDANSCTASASASITQPAAALSLTTSKVDVNCFGSSTGSATVAPIGGTPLYSYLWNTNPVQTTATATNLKLGNYTVTVTDANNCSETANVTINEPADLTVNSTFTNVSCNSCNDAAINLTVSGGTVSYSFAWTGPDGFSATSQNIASLKPGSYSVVVTDAHNCSKTAYAEVINPYVVTNISDADEIGTLRYAINYANAHNAATADLITFNIPIGLLSTIQPVSALPEIDQSLVIDGFTQPGASFSDLILRIELEGTNAAAGSNGLTIKSNNCTVKGLIIDGFSGNGIQIASGTGNTISANSIFSNDALGIDLGTNGAVTTNDAGDPDTGPNNLQNFPVLGSLSFSPGYVTVNGTLNSLRSSLTYKLEFFANKVTDNTGYGEGQTYLGSSTVTTNSAGNATFTVTLPTMTKYGDVITATATDPTGNTSEFSQAIGGLQDQILSSTKIPFHYQVNGKGVKSITSTAVVNEVRSAFGNWTGITTSGMSFVYDRTTAPPKYASASDNINLVSFTDDKFPFSPGILAVTAKTLKIGANDGVAQIIDADIVFNPYFVNNSTYDFGIADNPSFSGFFDIQSVTTHEIGHILGLLHSGVYNATMWFEVGPGTTLRSLEQDDKSWLSYRYPNTNYNQTFGSISGNIKYGYNNDPVAGAIVLAVNPATSLAVVHAYSDANGNYLIPGLPPGSYRVYIMPLDGDVYGRDLRPGNISSYIYSNTIYTDYPGEFYNNPDLDVETNTTPTPVTVLAGQVTTGIDFLTNKDVSNPTVVSVVPANNATNVSVLPNILITFSEPVDMNSLTGNSCYLTLSGSSTKIGGKYQPNGFEDKSDVVLFTLPENALSYESEYTLHITTAVTDLKTNPLGAEFTSTFRTGTHDVVPPTIKSTIPENTATNVFLTQKIMVFFSEPMIKSTVESSFVLTTDNGTINVDCTPSWDGYSTFTLSPKSPLIEGNTYSLIWTNAATDLSGNGLAASSISFNTIPVAPPTIVYMEPGSSLKSNVAVGTAIVVDFSEPINTATVNVSTFKLLSGTSQVSGKFEFINENSRVIFRPYADLTFGKTYTITLTGGIQDVSQVKKNFAGVTTTFIAATKPLKPHIDYNDPAGTINLTIEIGGNGFDPDPSKNKVTFSGITSSGVDAFAIYPSSLTSLTVKVPYGAVSGAIRVTSNGVLDDQDPNNLTTYIFIGSYPDPCNTATGNIGTGSNPRDGALDFNGANAYVTNSGENTVSVITNLNTDDPVIKPPYELLPRIQVGTTPMKIDINLTGTRAYVTNFDSHNVSVIDLTNEKKNQVISTIKVGVNPFGVVAKGDKVYVANYGSNNITVINVDPASGGFDHAVANINTGTHNRDIDITADGGTLVVTGDNGLTLVKMTKTALGFDYAVSNANSGTSTRDVTITNDAGTAIVTTNDGGIFFVDIAPGDNFGAAYGNYNPPAKAGDGKTTFDGAYYYVTNPDDDRVTVYKITYEGSGSGSGTISSSSRLTLKEYAFIPVGDSPEGIAMDLTNNKVVVVNSGSSSVTPVYICCPAVKTASDYIKDLIFAVQGMIYSGDIPKLRGYALIFTLNRSLININAGRTKLAIADLKVFIGLVNTYIKNKQINTDKGNALIAAANAIIAKLQGTKSDTTESSLTDIGQSNLQDLISESKLGVIYPNPFGESVTINYEIAECTGPTEKVQISIYDISGRLVGTLVDKNVQSGRYSTLWSGRYDSGGPAPYGTYFVRFKAGNTEEVKQIMLVR